LLSRQEQAAPSCGCGSSPRRSAQRRRSTRSLVPAGAFVSLLGPSGSGKTTTLNLIAGFLAPDIGEIFLDGRSIADVPPHRRNIGMVFQS
jgi:ABC-type Fe3+/spermidine/putrescine transport system ATPase subunit